MSDGFSNVFDYLLAHRWIIEVFAIVLSTGTARFFSKLFLDGAEKRAAKTANYWDDILLHSGRKPLGVLIWVVGISFAAEVVGGEAQAELFGGVPTLRDVAVLWVFIWFALRFIREAEIKFITDGAAGVAVDTTTATAVGKLLRASIAITGVLMALQAFGFSVSGVLAFGGIGGIAVGFAARDLLANFFGALMIFLDRPFSVGDWIRSPDRNIEGTVEDIGWRQTRIRTFDKRPLYIPNSVFTSLAVENPSRMLNRRIYETIGLRYDDIDQMQAVLVDIKAMLKAHPDIDHDQILMVNFNAFGPSSVDFFVYTFTKTTVWVEYHAIKEDVLLKIAAIVAAHDAEIAFPTQTLHLQVEPEALPANVSNATTNIGANRE